jgi:hypothetical protein
MRERGRVACENFARSALFIGVRIRNTAISERRKWRRNLANR